MNEKRKKNVKKEGKGKAEKGKKFKKNELVGKE